MNAEEWNRLRNKANNLAIDEYASEASSIIRLTRDEISAVIDEAAVDKDKLSELVAVVNDAARTNSQKAEAIRTTAGLAEIAASLIGRLV